MKTDLKEYLMNLRLFRLLITFFPFFFLFLFSACFVFYPILFPSYPSIPDTILADMIYEDSINFAIKMRWILFIVSFFSALFSSVWLSGFLRINNLKEELN